MNADGTDWTFDFCGGHLAIDFANTVSNRHTDAPIERLPSYAALVRFARQAKLVSPAEAERLLGRARRRPAEAEAVRVAAVRLREALYALLAAVSDERRPDAASLAALNDWVPRLQIGDDLRWRWAAGPDALDGFLAPVVSAALDLLMTGPRQRVHICSAEDCVWLYLDTSKNRSRRWCDMKVCGNRVKARRFNARRREASPDAR